MIFPVPTRTVIDLQRRSGGRSKRGRDQHPPARRPAYGPDGTLDFVDNSVTGNTDTMTCAASIPNPLARKVGWPARELVDGEFVTVMLEDVQPIEALADPARRRAVRPARRLCLSSSTRENKAREAPRQARPVDAGASPSIIERLDRRRAA